MSSFIRNRRLLDLLADICSQLNYSHYTEHPLTGGATVAWPVGDITVELLQQINMQLRMNFRIYQRDNIEDFLAYLETYFQPGMKEALDKKTWLVCEQGRWFICDCHVSLISVNKIYVLGERNELNCIVSPVYFSSVRFRRFLDARSEFHQKIQT